MATHALGRTAFGDPKNAGNLMTIEEAHTLLNEWVPNERLRLHMKQVAAVMKAWALEKEHADEKTALERILEQYKHFNSDLKLSKREMLMRSIAWQQAIKPGTSLSEKEMHNLARDLFACQTPNVTPSGRPTYLEFKKDQLEKMFGR